jgi:phosphatidylglycerophosphate synthase
MTGALGDKPASDIADRRPLASRQSGFAKWGTAVLLATPITPNQISILSIVFAGAAGLALYGAAQTQGMGAVLLFLLAAQAIQLRLLCNLFDGLVAVEGRRGGKDGGLFNEAPDRVADSVIIIALGYAADVGWLGWAGALAAALTAYVRVLGGSLGQPQDFSGPMAKQHRMALITGAALLAIIESVTMDTRWVLFLAAWIVFLGSALTAGRRLIRLRRQLLEQDHA